MQTTDFKKRRVTVMGLGRFGGGVGVVNYLIHQGAIVTLTDLQHEDALKESLAQIDASKLDQLILGKHRKQDFINTDCVVINPGIVAAKNRYIRAATEAGVYVTTEINLFWERCQAKMIAVTGTVGKSTTSSLIAHLLRDFGMTCHLGGNIGISLLNEVETFTENDWVVLELSSFQLEYLKDYCPRPQVTVITNFHENHLDWHGDISAYRKAKQVALKWQKPNDLTIMNIDDDDIRHWKSEGTRISIGTEIDSETRGVNITPERLEIQSVSKFFTIPFCELPDCLKMPHQRMNLAAALAVVTNIHDSESDSITASLKSFRTLPHRLECIAEKHGIQYINDSKATTPEATQSALAAMTRPVVLIAGGKDKRIDVSELCRSISKHVKAVALIGDTALLMALLLPEYRTGLLYSVHHDLASAFRWCHKQLVPGDTLLLSPGGSSDSQFLNYEDRGNQFKALVDAISLNPSQCSGQ